MKQLFFLLLFSCSYACTDFVIEASDGSLVNGRSLEFALDLKSALKAFPRNEKVTTMAPNQRPGMNWVTKYGYIGVNCLGLNFSLDGMNEVGLSVGYLWLPNITEYPKVQSQEMKQALDFTDISAWILGNFSTVAEVKEALKNVRIWGHPVQGLGFAPIHVAVHDTKGGNIVIEFIGGKVQVHENPISVLTNAPSFDWHLSNLQNYLNLSPFNPNPTNFRGVKISILGEGGGLLGIPGDWSPPSRFVKTATLLRFTKEVVNGAEAVNLAEHLLNAVDIPFGAVRAPNEEGGDYTQWVVIKDMTQKVFYFRSYGDLALKKIDMKKLNFSKLKKNSLPLDIKKGYFDVTDSLGSSVSVTVMKE